MLILYQLFLFGQIQTNQEVSCTLILPSLLFPTSLLAMVNVVNTRRDGKQCDQMVVQNWPIGKEVSPQIKILLFTSMKICKMLEAWRGSMSIFDPSN